MSRIHEFRRNQTLDERGFDYQGRPDGAEAEAFMERTKSRDEDDCMKDGGVISA